MSRGRKTTSHETAVVPVGMTAVWPRTGALRDGEQGQVCRICRVGSELQVGQGGDKCPGDAQTFALDSWEWGGTVMHFLVLRVLGGEGWGMGRNM